MRTSLNSAPHRSSGFSLIEVMVGLMIGMLAVIAIMQVFAGAEGNKRTTTGGDDAQISGTIALYGLERDIREAGFGINSFNLLGCSLSYKTTADDASVTLDALAPVIINPPITVVPAGDAKTDTLLVFFGSPDGPTEGDLMSTTPSAGSYPVTTPDSFAVNDFVIAQPATRPATCALTLGKVTAKAASTLTVTPGDATGLTLGSVVFNLGRTLNIRAYAIRKGNLTMCDYSVNNCGDTAYITTLNSDVWVPVATNIVSLRAQYGKDTSGISTSQMTGVVDSFNQITPGTKDDESGLAVQCGWGRTLAVRLALVSRNVQYDKLEPTTAAPVWAGTTVTTASPVNATALTIDLSGDTDWTHYRYKTLQTTVPIRNVLWQDSQTALKGGASAC
ncbi:PilW family protein [Variovorax saccharolyticus]|uniref:PilW family protein n=1 Tax=Variovorax saccharolyticus TaxID=3053516 RepID=UPI0025776FA2|nr:PilW family protein [Variovorax sp. J31P216]MDM0027649.1 PilW family protein [Variovorax sp. J31P216]